MHFYSLPISNNALTASTVDPSLVLECLGYLHSREECYLTLDEVTRTSK